METIIFNKEDSSKLLNNNYKYYKTPYDEFNRINNSNDYINKLIDI